MKNAKSTLALLKLSKRNLKENVAVKFNVEVTCGADTKATNIMVKFRKLKAITSLKDLGIRSKNIEIVPKYKAKMTQNIDIKVDFSGMSRLAAQAGAKLSDTWQIFASLYYN